MSIFDRLYTPATRPTPNLQKGATPSRLEAKAAKEKADEALLRAWRDQVFERDERKCRCCGVRVLRLQLRVLDPRRAEAHHVAGRDDRAVRYDVRNGITLCLKCHERVTGIVGAKLRIIGSVFFTKSGQRYINAQYPVRFDEVA